MTSMLPPSKDEQKERSEKLCDLVKMAMDKFNAMSQEEQRAHRNAQCRSWIIGEMMLENPDMTLERAEKLADECLREAGRI